MLECFISISKTTNLHYQTTVTKYVLSIDCEIGPFHFIRQLPPPWLYYCNGFEYANIFFMLHGAGLALSASRFYDDLVDCNCPWNESFLDRGSGIRRVRVFGENVGKVRLLFG